jgi:peptide methionine sulfoxide reductase MsrA
LAIDGAQDKGRSYNSAVYADDEDEAKSAMPETKKKSTFGKLNPVTWFEKEAPAT